MEEKNIWNSLEKILKTLNFSDSEIEKVRKDLVMMIKSESVISLLETLPDQEKLKIKSEIINSSENQKNRLISDKLKNYFSEKQINEHIQMTTDSIVKDYLNHIINKLDISNKKNILDELVNLSR